MRSIRARSISTSGGGTKPSHAVQRFIGQLLRSGTKPECISAMTLCASARSTGPEGRRPRSGNASARCQAMAMLSVRTPPSGVKATGTERWPPKAATSVWKLSE
jgi:hypothetical protein